MFTLINETDSAKLHKKRFLGNVQAVTPTAFSRAPMAFSLDSNNLTALKVS